MNQNKLFYSWEDFDLDVKEFTKLLKNNRPDVIIGIARGGVCLATTLSYNLGDVPVYYFDPKRDNFSNLPVDFAKDKILFVDDINDTGSTMKNVRSLTIKTVYHEIIYLGARDFKLNNVKYLTVFQKKSSLEKVDYFGRIIDDEWVVFPWENG